MNLLEKLRAAAIHRSLEGEFPDWLLADILKIADTPDRFADRVHLVETLITQIGNFDPYAGVGCFDTSVGADAIRTTIRQIAALPNGQSGAKTCEIFACCQFFSDNMRNLPKSAEYIKNKLCLDDYESCNRYRIYKAFDGEDKNRSYLDPADAEEVKKVIQCLGKKQELKG